MAVCSLADELWQEVLSTRENAHLWDSIPASLADFVVVDMQNYFVQPKSSGVMSSVSGIAPRIKRLAGAVRENGDPVIRIQNATTDSWDTWPVRHVPQSSESARYRVTAMELGAKSHRLWTTLEPHAIDAFLAKKLYSALEPGSNGAAMLVHQ